MNLDTLRQLKKDAEHRTRLAMLTDLQRWQAEVLREATRTGLRPAWVMKQQVLERRRLKMENKRLADALRHVRYYDDIKTVHEIADRGLTKPWPWWRRVIWELRNLP